MKTIQILMSLVFAKEECMQTLLDFLFYAVVGRVSGVVEEVENSDHEELSDGECKKWMLFFGGFSFCLLGKRARDFAFVSLCYERSEEELC
jgi:hypothetical protein